MSLTLLGAGKGTLNSGGGGQLSAGEYWASGNVSLDPNVGNYASTANFNDGSPGNTTTRETSSGASITIIHVHASSFSIASWAQTVKYTGTFSASFSRWNGSSWVGITDTEPSGWPFNLGYLDVSRTATFSGVPSSTIYRCVLTEDDTSNGGSSVSDSRPA